MVQVEKERTEYKKRVDRMEEEADTLKTETTMLKRDLEEVKIVTAYYLIPHICPFWYTTTLFRLAENTPKVRKFATK